MENLEEDAQSSVPKILQLLASFVLELMEIFRQVTFPEVSQGGYFTNTAEASGCSILKSPAIHIYFTCNLLPLMLYLETPLPK